MRVKDVPRYKTAPDGWMELEVPELGTSSSSTARIKDEAEEIEKRSIEDAGGEDSTPSKAQKISSLCIGFGAADQMGEIPRTQSYESNLVELVKEYEEAHSRGEDFVHIRNRHSSNRDLRAMSALAGGEQFCTVSLKGG